MRVRPLLVASAVLGSALVPAAVMAPSPASAAAGKQTYIVTLGSGLPAVVADTAARTLGGEVGFVYTDALRGFSVELPTAALPALRALPGVVAVEADAPVHAAATQVRPPFGLDRIDQRRLPVDQRYSYALTGSGVNAYVIDTGLRKTHVDFKNRGYHGIDTVDGGAADDCNGHGTHVAGTLGGTSFGVAKQVRLIGVRVLGCDGSGTISGVIKGVDWVTAAHRPGQPAVANMSLGGGVSAALDRAVQRSINDGITYAVASGNAGGLVGGLTGAQDASNSSPGRVPAALTVAASDQSDRRASFSNTGSRIDVFAPGVSVRSTWYTSNSATNTLNGTSMASPHVAGVAALYLQKVRSASPAAVSARIVSLSSKGVLQGSLAGSPNRLLFNGV